MLIGEGTSDEQRGENSLRHCCGAPVARSGDVILLDLNMRDTIPPYDTNESKPKSRLLGLSRNFLHEKLIIKGIHGDVPTNMIHFELVAKCDNFSPNELSLALIKSLNKKVIAIHVQTMQLLYKIFFFQQIEVCFEMGLLLFYY